MPLFNGADIRRWAVTGAELLVLSSIAVATVAAGRAGPDVAAGAGDASAPGSECTAPIRPATATAARVRTRGTSPPRSSASFPSRTDRRG
jgi:hypothetical protein